jgi:Outer membrane protein beta-barrel domain
LTTGLPSALSRAALCLAVLAAFARPAAAEWHLTPLIGFTFKGDTTLINETTQDDDLNVVTAVSKVHWNFGGATTLIGAGPIGVEAIFLYTPGFLQQDLGVLQKSKTLALMGNMVLAMPRGWNEYGLRPFVSGGLGLLRVSAEDLPPVDFYEDPINIFGYNVGGGAVGFITERTGLRFDLRYFSHVRPKEDLSGTSFGPIELRYWNASVGVVFRY